MQPEPAGNVHDAVSAIPADAALWARVFRDAKSLDRADPLALFRDRFYTQPGRIYLDGNSLGLLSRDAEAAVLRVLDEWKAHGVEGWTAARPPWFILSETLAQGVAALVGAGQGEVIVTGSTTSNLHQLLATLYEPNAPGGKTKIVADALNFPSDLFAIDSHLRLRGLNPAAALVKVASRDGRTLHLDDVLTALALPGVQMAILPSVVYVSGQLLPIAQITREARARGVVIGWDCSHSVGAVPHELSAWDADFAFWCHYKYLNAGPGAVGGLYLNRRHHGRAPGLAGWFGSRKDRQFDLTHDLTPAPDAGALQIGTPHILSLAPLAGALQIHGEAGLDRIREKSLALTDFLRSVAEDVLGPMGVTFATPKAHAQRGGHLALIHPDAARLSRALRAAGVVPDFRPPDVIRLAPVALYTSFTDCAEAIHRLHTLLSNPSADDETPADTEGALLVT